MQEEDNFRKIFKYYKSKNEVLDFSKIISIADCNSDIKFINTVALNQEMDAIRASLGLQATHQWNVFTYLKQPGLIIIQNPFLEIGSLTWIRRCLTDFSNIPHKTNLSQLGLTSDCNSWFINIFNDLVRGDKNKLINQLRWATLGYHHNWDTKVYSKEEISPMPKELQELCQVILSGVGLSEYRNYKAEAAIVNYYPLGSTLSPHTDHSEPYKEAPLLSFSFGRSAIFLIGGPEKWVEPTPFYINHGDVMIMTKSSRLSYHAVPRILGQKDNEHLTGANISKLNIAILTLIELLDCYNISNKCSPDSTFIDVHRLMINWHAEAGGRNCDFSSFLKSLNIDSFISETTDAGESKSGLENIYNVLLLRAIYNYITSIRININVRQVNEENK